MRDTLWYQRHVTELWTDLALLSRDAAALHALLSDLAFIRDGSLPEDEEELRRVVGVSDSLWNSWSEIAHLWPAKRLRGGNNGSRTVRVNLALREAFSQASEACSTNRKRAKKGAAGRWKKGRAVDASSNALSNADRQTDRQTEEEEEKTPLTPLRGGPTKRDVQKMRDFEKQSVGKSDQAFREDFRRRFGFEWEAPPPKADA
jgi:uncharacterized protein YdaU (DUF1376 family)